jgi:hypothetical protein
LRASATDYSKSDIMTRNHIDTGNYTRGELYNI